MQNGDVIDSALSDRLADFYRDLHEYPELSFQEHRTASKIIEAVDGLGLEATGEVGGTGVVAVLRNGDGPVVMLRADMDALPVAEQTGLPYASTADGIDQDGAKVQVMHACGHDMHVTCLIGALTVLSGTLPDWSGTIVAVFQPAEELLAGAQALIDDGLFERFPKPAIILGQHVGPLPAGLLAYCPGPAMASADSLLIKLYGRGGHGSRPETSVDPIVMAASGIMRLQTVVSREIAPSDTAVVTVGSFHAGTKENIIPGEAELKVNIRSFSEPVRAKVLGAIERIVKGEAAAAGAPRDPDVIVTTSGPVLVNDVAATTTTVEALQAGLGADKILQITAVSASEDFGLLGTAAGVPSVFWFFGGPADEIFHGKQLDEVPSNHSAEFAPAIEPTLTTGIEALVTAARAWLSPGR
jgi:hippurate hydrolase